MIKIDILDVLYEELTDEELGALVRMCLDYQTKDQANTNSNPVVNSFFKLCRKEIDHNKRISETRSKAKKGKTKAEVVDNGENGN